MRSLTFAATAAILAVMVGCLTGCPSKNPSSVNTSSSVTVGAVLPLTGNASFIGEAEKNTLTWLVDDYNRNAGSAGPRINLVVYDSAGDPSQAVNFVRRLVESDQAKVVIGPGTSGESLAAKDIAAQAQVPMLSLAASHKIVESVNPWIFKLAQNDSLAVETIYNYLLGQNKQRLALLTASDGFGASGREQLQQLAGERKMTILYDETFAPTATDLTAQLGRVKASGAEVVVVWGTNPGPAVITKNMRQLGMKQLLVQSHGVASKKFIELAGPAANGVVLPAGKLLVADALPANDPQRPVLIEYRDGYKSKYNAPVSTFGGHAWDAFQLLKASFQKGHFDPREIRDDLEAQKGFVGVTGIFTFSPQDHAGLTKDAFVIMRIENGDWKLVQ
jgi:branched-chain amino acid transport system substrate-binding protein